jgi:TPP-dependent indolepyruvate ferredoxin oxidoreductase alpha subunit
MIGDGGFWHNGLSTSVGNAVFNKHDGVIMVVDNFYSAATGGQDIMSSRALNPARKTNNTIVDAVKGIGVKWVRQIDRTYDVARMRDTLARGADHAKRAARRSSSPRRNACSTSSAGRSRCSRSRCATGSAWCASASASTRTSAPAITPASGCPAARRCRSSTPTIR